jgi:hypothetical protein
MLLSSLKIKSNLLFLGVVSIFSPSTSCLLSPSKLQLGGACSWRARGHVSPRERFSKVNLASTLLMMSGSGAGSILRGGARGHWAHLLWPHRVHARGSMVSPRACPSGLLGCGTGGKVFMHWWQSYLMGEVEVAEYASPG